MSKAKFHVLRKDRDALPKEVKGIYSGDEFINQLTVIFSSEEQMEGFHGIVVE